MRSLWGTGSITASASGICRTSTCSHAELVTHDRRNPLAVLAQPVRTRPMGVLVQIDQPRQFPFQPLEVVLAHARVQVQKDRADVVGAGVQAGPGQPPDLLLAVADAGQ